MAETDFSLVVGFEWDEGNTRKNAEKHDVSQAEAEQVFFNDPLLVAEDVKHSQAEPTLHALGKAEANRLLHITFMLRQVGALIRVISARDMSRKERKYFASEADKERSSDNSALHERGGGTTLLGNA
jgi:hypothetical protein